MVLFSLPRVVFGCGLDVVWWFCGLRFGGFEVCAVSRGGVGCLLDLEVCLWVSIFCGVGVIQLYSRLGMLGLGLTLGFGYLVGCCFAGFRCDLCGLRVGVWFSVICGAGALLVCGLRAGWFVVRVCEGGFGCVFWDWVGRLCLGGFGWF